uniref:Protein kinase domain-containing protein n=1 Tax=viral metagenome TaxID=1070528 RepID=A0A6C0D3U3_9ZZZZ
MSLSYQFKSSRSEFLGEGSYGCVYYPGITCKGKKNKKNLITKIQEINFYSDNEKNNGKYIKANIKNYNKYLSPVIKYCIVKFNTIERSDLNISKCNILFDEYNSSANVNYEDIIYNSSATRDSLPLPKNSIVNEQYILMYSSYIKSYTLKDFYSNYTIEFVSSVLTHSYKILYGISLLNNVGIIHNDLHIGNVLINLKNLNPVIIDFGLSFNINNCYKLNKDYIDFQYIKRFVFDYRDDSYHINIEKRFISFIIFNKSANFPSEIYDNNDSNNISKAAINYFISDAINSINNNKEIVKFFTSDDLIDFQTALEQFYYQFLDKSLYPKYNSVVKYLLNFVYMYNDLHSLTIDLLYLVDLKEYKQNLILNNEEQVILHFFIQLYKKALYPDPNMRLNISEVLDIYKFIINFIKKYDLKTAKNNIRATMISELVKFLKSKKISIKTVFYKNYAFLNFNLLCNDLIFQTIKSSSISL